MNVVCLSSSDRNLLCLRWNRHGNSQRRMLEALAATGAGDAGARLSALRSLEKRFDLDLAEICYRHARRNDESTHPIERLVVEFITEERPDQAGTQLWILTDRLQQVRELMEGKLVGDAES
ncbi:MAG: hypothetical protein WD054_01160 [Gemmatimonadota bacterium]